MRDDDVTIPVLGEANYKNIIVKRKEIFHVKFPHPVPIQPRTPYRAWFSLEVYIIFTMSLIIHSTIVKIVLIKLQFLQGPVTCHGGSSASTIEVAVPVNSRSNECVKFTYSIVGANQLPEIMFHA